MKKTNLLSLAFLPFILIVLTMPAFTAEVCVDSEQKFGSFNVLIDVLSKVEYVEVSATINNSQAQRKAIFRIENNRIGYGTFLLLTPKHINGEPNELGLFRFDTYFGYDSNDKELDSYPLSNDGLDPNFIVSFSRIIADKCKFKADTPDGGFALLSILGQSSLAINWYDENQQKRKDVYSVVFY